MAKVEITAHAEIVGHLDCVEKALTDPTFINRDKDFPSRENYYRPFTLPPPFDRTYLKVCVEFRRNGIRRMLVGEVVTAFSTGGVKQGETQLWP